MSLGEQDQAGDAVRDTQAEKPQRQQPGEPYPDAKQPTGSGSKDPGDKVQADESAKKSSPLPKIIGGLLLLIAIAAGVYYYLSTKDIESTDDAFTDGRSLTISPKIAGYVTELLVDDNQRVVTGQVLARIDGRDYITARDAAAATVEVAEAQKRSAEFSAAIARRNFPARLAQAQGDLEQARAKLFQAQTDYKRQRSVAAAATTQANVDQATANLQAAQGQVTSAEAVVQQATPVQENIGTSVQQVSQLAGQLAQGRAQLAQAELNITYATIKAPQDGWITKRNIEVGNYLQPGASIFAIVTPEVWITANFKESQLSRMRVGQHVTISVDAYPNMKLDGHVDSIQLGSGSRFTAFPPENATGNFVKIVQRVPVKIIIDRGMDPAKPLPLGISVVPTVELK